MSEVDVFKSYQTDIMSMMNQANLKPAVAFVMGGGDYFKIYFILSAIYKSSCI